MITLRSLIYFLFLVFSTALFGLLIVLVGWLLPFKWRSMLANAWGWLNMLMLKWICGLDHEVHGAENIQRSGAIYLSKHQSAWETMALRYILPPEQSWVLKRELMWVPIFGWALALVSPIAINRKSGRRAVKQVIEQGRDRLDKGRNVVIFPEGTRVAPGERKRYGVGGALLAEKTGRPVIPVAHNAGIFWRRRGLNKLPGTIHVVIGPAIKTDGLSATQLNRVVETWIEEVVARLPTDIETPLDREAIQGCLSNPIDPNKGE